MPRHQQVTICRTSGGPVSKFCGCEHCTLAVCSVCGAYEGSLTTDCPGEQVSFDRQKEVYETRLDYSDARGWHQGVMAEHRAPHFTPSSSDATAAELQQALVPKAVAWVRADREAADRSASLTRLEDEVDQIKTQLPEGGAVSPRLQELLNKIAHEAPGFHLASDRAEKCDDEFRQAARKIVDALERAAK